MSPRDGRIKVTIMIEHEDHYSKTVEEPYLPDQLHSTETVREVAERVLERALRSWE